MLFRGCPVRPEPFPGPFSESFSGPVSGQFSESFSGPESFSSPFSESFPARFPSHFRARFPSHFPGRFSGRFPSHFRSVFRVISGPYSESFFRAVFRDIFRFPRHFRARFPSHLLSDSRVVFRVHFLAVFRVIFRVVSQSFSGQFSKSFSGPFSESISFPFPSPFPGRFPCHFPSHFWEARRVSVAGSLRLSGGPPGSRPWPACRLTARRVWRCAHVAAAIFWGCCYHARCAHCVALAYARLRCACRGGVRCAYGRTGLLRPYYYAHALRLQCAYVTIVRPCPNGPPPPPPPPPTPRAVVIYCDIYTTVLSCACIAIVSNMRARHGRIALRMQCGCVAIDRPWPGAPARGSRRRASAWSKFPSRISESNFRVEFSPRVRVPYLQRVSPRVGLELR